MHTAPVPGLLILRFDGPLYTANVRCANRAVLAAVDAHPGTGTLVIDTTAQAETPLSVVSEYAQLERDLTDRGVTLWIAGLPPRSLALAKQLPSWDRLEQAGRLHPTALAALPRVSLLNVVFASGITGLASAHGRTVVPADRRHRG